MIPSPNLVCYDQTHFSVYNFLTFWCLALAIAALKEREAGTFLIRDSNSFQGAYGLALKVATPPPNVNNHSSKGKNNYSLRHLNISFSHFCSTCSATAAQSSHSGYFMCHCTYSAVALSLVDNDTCILQLVSAVTVSDPLEQLVRHFLIETGPRGVKIKGCQNEPYFGTFSCSRLLQNICSTTNRAPLGKIIIFDIHLVTFRECKICLLLSVIHRESVCISLPTLHHAHLFALRS